MKNLLSIIFIVLIACSSPSDENALRPTLWHGNWNAEWETPPESYPEAADMEFQMTGLFVFTQDSLTKTINGYPGCIFAIDTFSHTQSWQVSGDTLSLMNKQGMSSITYQIVSKSNDQIKLQLMKDIFVTLSK